jgi:hypothetical protein
MSLFRSTSRRHSADAGGRLRTGRGRVSPWLESLEDRELLAIFTVTSNADTIAPGTLRSVITAVNSSSDTSNTVLFDINSSGHQVIQLTSALPAIQNPVVILGNTQPGFSGAPLIEIQGGSASSFGDGLTLGAGSSHSAIVGLTINGFTSGYGIKIFSSNDVVYGCYLGTDSTGFNPMPNEGGIGIEGGDNSIGGTTPGTPNVISGNLNYGIDIEAPSCLVEGNLIGTNAAGSAPLANGSVGVLVDGTDTTVGGSAAGASNLISGNAGSGVFIEAPSCLVEGNRIGTNLAGSAPLANGDAGVYVSGTGSTVGGSAAGASNLISGNGSVGVDIAAQSCLVEGNQIGTNLAGSDAVANGFDGVYVSNSGAGTTVGGTAAGASNLISGNDHDGVDINAQSCLVEGNQIGTNLAGTAALDNHVHGVYVGAIGTTVGGSAAGASNLISGNGFDGVDIAAQSCLVEGNRIGTNLAGTAAVANSLTGVVVGDSNATLGGTAAGASNLISGNGSDGVDINAPSCLVEGNQIGTNLAGSAAVANGSVGVAIYNPGAGASLGGTSAGASNLISGNGSDGVDINAPSCLIEGNQIGTNLTGTAALANGLSGVYVGATGVTVGGTMAGASNLISGNADGGIGIDAESCLVEGNRIGTNLAGTAALANGLAGVYVDDIGVTVGGTSAGASNLISGNYGGGVVINAQSCLVEGNRIGTNAAVTNGAFGVLVTSTGATIGVAGSGNIIAFNAGPGVATLAGATGNTIRFNAIFSNAIFGIDRPGIDLNDDGVTPNTPNGPNNTPVLISADGANISGKLNAAPNSTYVLDFYGNLPADASPTRPQGRDYLTSITVTTNAAGDAVFTVPYTPIPGVPILTATATDAAGTTSEFSPPLGYRLASTGVTFSATVGVPFQGTVADFSSTDPSATTIDFAASINWGDGSNASAGTIVAAPGGFIVTGSHTFSAANPTEPVTVTITDTRGLGAGVANSLADVSSPGGLLTPFSRSVPFVAGTVSTGVVAGFTDSNTHAFPGEFTATIAWGDGTASSAGTVSADGGGFDVNGAHTYNVAGSYSVTVSINDTLTGATVTASSTAAVAPVPITINPQNFAVTGKKNFSGTVATFTDGDPRIDPTFYTATIKWGDGSANSTGIITGTNPFKVTASHTFLSFSNTDLVTITITDKNGRTATAVDRVVDPPAILAVQASGLTLSRNAPFLGPVATFTDSGPAEAISDYKAMINWGKGRQSAGMITGSNGRFVVSARHRFPRFSGAKTVTVTVTDQTDGRMVSVSEPASYAGRPTRSIPATHRTKRVSSKSHR